MDLLKQAALDYEQLINREYRFVLSNGQEIRVVFKRANFKHLAGLHKLKDMFWNASQRFDSGRLMRMIKKDQITEQLLKNSHFYDEREEKRLMSLCQLSELLVPGGNVIYPFERAKCKINISFKSDAMFFKSDQMNCFIIFGAAQDQEGKYFYPETLFYREDDAYIEGQDVATIDSVDVTLYGPNKL